jgi:hypothetical protein
MFGGKQAMCNIKCRFAGNCTMEDTDLISCEKYEDDKRKRRNAARRERDQAMRDMGLVKVRGPLSGSTYWE